MGEFFGILFLLSIPICAYVALILAIGARRKARDTNEGLRKRVRDLTRRVEDLEALRAPPRFPEQPQLAPPPVAPPPTRPAPAPPPPPAPPPQARKEPEPVPAPAAEARREPAPALPELTELRAPGPSLEERIGGRWFNWVGILAILFGVAYAMKYSFEQGWVTPTMRFHGGLLLGILLLAAGGYSERRRYAVLARGFWGGGIGILFVVLFAGFKLLHVGPEPIIGRGVAFAGMALTVLAGVGIAIRYDTRTTAALSAIGGYLTPVLLRTGVPDQVFLFTYLLILTGGLLFLGYWKRWGFLRLLTFSVIVAYFAGWWFTEGTGAPWAMLLYPSALFLFFTAEILAWSIWRRVADASLSYVVLGLATTLHALSGLSVLEAHFIAFRGAFLLLSALVLALGARWIARRHEEDFPLALCYGYAAGLLFLAVPLFEARLHAPWVSCAWALEGLALFLGEEVWGARGHARWFGYAAYALGAAGLLAVDTPQVLADVSPYLPFWNRRALAFAIVTLAFVFGCARTLRLERQGRADDASHLAATGLWIVTLSLPAVLLSLELAQAMRVYVSPRFGGETPAYVNRASNLDTLLWGAYATLVATVTSRRGRRVLRDVAFLFGAFVLAHFVIRGLADTYTTQTTPILNTRFGVTLSVALCLAWCAREFRFPPGRGAAHLFLLAGLAMEWVDLCTVRGIGRLHRGVAGLEPRLLAGAPWLGVTILVAGYGSLLAGWGARALRPLAFGLALAAAAKFMAIDLPVLGIRSSLQLRGVTGAFAASACFFAAAFGWSTFLRVLGHMALVVALSADLLDAARASGWKNHTSAMTGLWAAYGLGALWFGILRARPHLRAFGLLLLWLSAAVGVTVLVVAGERAPHLLGNARFACVGATALALLLAARLYRRRAPGAPVLRWGGFVEGSSLAAPLSLAGHAIAMLVLTLEAADHFHLAGAERHMRQLSYSLIWALYAIGMVTYGLRRRDRPVRLMALAVLMATILKVFVLDLSFLENPYRILSFLVLGAILVAVSFLYQKYRDLLV